jgi:hypothetical protein
MLTTYTPYDSIRAVLGVSAKELKDETLGLVIWETQFLLEMGDVDGGAGQVMALYNGLPSTGRTVNQQQLYDLVNMLATYSVARQMLTPAPLAVPQKITDGKAAVERFSASNFDRVRDGVLGTYNQLLARLKVVLVKLSPSSQVAATDRTFISSVSTGIDPVTGV